MFRVNTVNPSSNMSKNMFGTDEAILMDKRVCRAISKVQNEMKVAGKGNIPLFWTEWNVPGMNQVRDTTFVGPASANTVRQCDGLVTMMSFWTFSDVFEEGNRGHDRSSASLVYEQSSESTSQATTTLRFYISLATNDWRTHHRTSS